MNKLANMDFGAAVTTSFRPIADRAGLELQTMRPDIYQIAGNCFILRIRRGIGHRKDFLVTLSRLAASPRDLDDLSGEVGLSVIAEYNGVEMPYDDISSVQAFCASLRRAAETAEQFCMPYLTGQKSDFDEIRSFVDRKVEAAWEPPFKFPPNVREEWL
jgi:hypothetical protein